MEALCSAITNLYSGNLNDAEWDENVFMFEAYCERVVGFKGNIEQMEFAGPMAFMEFYQHEKIDDTWGYGHISSVVFSTETGFAVTAHSVDLVAAQARCAEVNAELLAALR